MLRGTAELSTEREPSQNLFYSPHIPSESDTFNGRLWTQEIAAPQFTQCIWFRGWAHCLSPPFHRSPRFSMHPNPSAWGHRHQTQKEPEQGEETGKERLTAWKEVAGFLLQGRGRLLITVHPTRSRAMDPKKQRRMCASVAERMLWFKSKQSCYPVPKQGTPASGCSLLSWVGSPVNEKYVWANQETKTREKKKHSPVSKLEALASFDSGFSKQCLQERLILSFDKWDSYFFSKRKVFYMISLKCGGCSSRFTNWLPYN